jgi:glycosyltransferase involved in cell wall biosynthesis
MAVAEALAHGLPVVSTTTGECPSLDWAGMLVMPGDRRALADALSRVIGDADVRARLANGARRVRRQLPGWDHAVDRMATTLASIDHE